MYKVYKVMKYFHEAHFVEVEQHLQCEERVVWQELRLQDGIADASVAVNARLKQ